MASKAYEMWEDNNGNAMLALCFAIVAFGSFAIYWSQATRITPMRVRFPIAPVIEGAQRNESTLRVRCDGLQSDIGICQLSVYHGSEGFNDPESAVMHISRQAKSGVALWELNGLPNGAFALTVFEDRNGNGQLDKGPDGVPIERYGFSNNPKTAGIPSFDEACIELNEMAEVEIHLRGN